MVDMRTLVWLLMHSLASLGWLLYALVWPPMFRGEPRVSYGYWDTSQTGSMIRPVRIGGFIKVMRLTQVFQNHPYRFNLVYLVSSCLPWGAPGLLLAAKLRGRKVVLNQNGVLYPGYHRWWWVYNVVNYVVWRWSDQVFYQSEFCQMSAEKWLPASIGIRR